MEDSPEDLLEGSKKSRPKRTARNKLMDYLARRDHSELELRDKLADKFSPDEIDEAVQYAHDNNWMLPEKELAEKVANHLHRKKKGAIFILNYLQKKGLPGVYCDKTNELEKAYSLLESKFRHLTEVDQKTKEKMFRRLANRGYYSDVIWEAINCLQDEIKEQRKKET